MRGGWKGRSAAALAALAWAGAAAAQTDPEGMAFYERAIAPLLAQHCLKCHGGGEKLRGGLDLSYRSGLIAGGTLGPAIDAAAPDNSLLLAMLSYADEDHEMPPAGKLPDEAIAAFAAWVRMGVPMPDHAPPPRAESEQASPYNNQVNDAARNWWAYRRVVRPPVPAVRDAAWANHPIDAFVQAQREAKGLRPVPEADRIALMRRAHFDLLGLPPAPEEAAAFAADPDPQAYEKLVDRLLASPHYGEKWGRHWLDLVRYAETNGYERDNPKPYIWRYRDYVVDSFNADKPYDRFVREQIAGDEFPDGGRDAIVATGFYRLGLWNDEPVDKLQERYDTLDGVIATAGEAFLGTTLGCARCHEHKIDPLPQRDYYRLLAFFDNVTDMHTTDITRNVVSGKAAAAFAAAERDHQRAIARRERAVRTAKRDFLDAYGAPATEADIPQLIAINGDTLIGPGFAARYERLRRNVDAARTREIPGGDYVACIGERGPEAPQTFVHLRGNPNVPGDPVQPGFPEVLGFPDPLLPTPPPDAATTGRRRMLADWIASPDNPLAARVMVNRIWQHHFGRGIVATPNDFGQAGARPTHPELLDWLAAEFVAGGWTLKRMHRMILLSRTYRLAAADDPANAAIDPGNASLWRFDMRRLSAEEVRDAMLWANGTINLAVGGPSVYPPMPREILETASRPDEAWKSAAEAERTRRSLYIHVKRSLLTPLLTDFDLADTDSSCPVRFSTTQPTQALNLLNSAFVNEQAAGLARRIERDAGGTPERVRRALALATGRTPDDAEIARGIAFLDDMQSRHGLAPEKALERFALLVLNLNEFVFVD